MEIDEFREKLHSYHRFMDSKTFINAFLDASSKYMAHLNNLELILHDMELAKADYEKKIKPS